MTDFKIKLVDNVFKIKCIHRDTYNLCRDYFTDEHENVLIEINNNDIEYERISADSDAISEGRKPINFSDGILETTAVYRKIADWFSYHNATVFHGALISLNNEGYLFTADSGTGKTTHINNWLKHYPDCFVINGDKPVLKINDNNIVGYGTPWAGKENSHKNFSVPIKAIVLLNRGKENSISKVDFTTFFSTIISQSYIPKDNSGILRVLNNAKQMEGKVKFYNLYCNMDEKSAEVAFNGINDNYENK